MSVDKLKVLIYINMCNGPAVCKRGNRGPWSAPVAWVHPRTTDHCKNP